MAGRGREGGSHGRKRRHDPRIGSRLPQQIRDELDQQGAVEGDDRRFAKFFVNKAAARKELRKAKRQAKGKRKAGQQNSAAEPAPKRQKREEEKKKKEKADDNDALERFAKANPVLAAGSSVVVGTSKEDFEKDDREIAYWEKKLGINKKKNNKAGLNKALEQDGLLELWEGLDGFDDDDGQEYLRQKRLKKKMEEEKQESSDEEMQSDSEALSDDDEIPAKDDSEQNDDSSEEEEAEEEEGNEEDEKQAHTTTTTTSQSNEDRSVNKTAASKYVPPHLRKAAATTESERQIKLRRLVQGLLNRLSESNLEGILLDIEKCYTNYPRHDVTSTITDLVLTSISQKTNLLDSFVVSYATVVAGLYRLIGVDFAAYLVQTLVERFEANYKSYQSHGRDKNNNNNNDEEEGIPGAKEAKNLLTLVLELYNFQVIACILVYDLVRLLISNLDEYSVELLLKIVKTAGPQLRSDDPASLKDIIDEIQKETNKRDASSLSVRHKFMLETLSNVKNNKIKIAASGQADKELVIKMKKFLNGLGKKRTIRSAEALRVSLEDIHQVDTKGKWWLVGASWKDNLVGTESKHSAAKMAKDLSQDQSMQEALLKLARKQGMNTDIRRSIFVTAMSAEDYLDAFEKLMKLGLTEVQQREIARVLLQCTGNEKTFNPFYMLVAKRFCEYSHSFKVTFQYCLWDFLRECGERDVGGLERNTMVEDDNSSSSSKVRLSRIVNVAKFYAGLVASGSLSLAILRSVNFMTLGQKGRLWLQLFFANVFRQLKENDNAGEAAAVIFAKIVDMKTLAQGCLFFLHETFLQPAGLDESDLEAVKWGYKIAKDVLK